MYPKEVLLLDCILRCLALLVPLPWPLMENRVVFFITEVGAEIAVTFFGWLRIVSIGVDAGVASQREICTECEGCSDGRRSSICRSIEQALLEVWVFMKHSHNMWYGFMNFPVVRTTIVSSATMR